MKRSTTATAVVLSGAAVFLALIAASGWVVAFSRLTPKETPLSITACSPADFRVDGVCFGDPPVDPDALVLTEDLRIEVEGRVRMLADRDVSYRVRVAWVRVEDGLEYPVVDVPITYESGRNQPYRVEWAPPPQLLATASGVPSGESLGEWRIVGTATPDLADRYAVFSWDSVKTFELIAP